MEAPPCSRPSCCCLRRRSPLATPSTTSKSDSQEAKGPNGLGASGGGSGGTGSGGGGGGIGTGSGSTGSGSGDDATPNGFDDYMVTHHKRLLDSDVAKAFTKNWSGKALKFDARGQAGGE